MSYEVCDYIFIENDGWNGTKIYEFDDDGEINLKDFISDFVDCLDGYDGTFKFYLSESNYGSYDCFAKYDNCELTLY